MQQKNKSSMHQKKGFGANSTQMYMNIAEIKENVIILKNGGLRAILQTSSVNFNLKSEDEQNSIIYSYQNFLNTLEFPIQIHVQSRKLDIDHYIDEVREKAKVQNNPLLKEKTTEYADYIERLIEYADIMEKNFYVIVPYDPYRSQNPNLLTRFLKSISAQDSIDQIKQRHKEFDELNKRLNERVNLVKTGLEGCNLRVAQLTTAQLIELMYQSFNPITSRNQKIEDLSKMDLKNL